MIDDSPPPQASEPDAACPPAWEMLWDARRYESPAFPQRSGQIYMLQTIIWANRES